MAVDLTFFDAFLAEVLKGTHDFSSDTFKAMLTNTAPVIATSAVKSDITQIANGNGYTTDGVTLSNVTLSAPSSGTEKLDCDDFSWLSASAGMATFRYGVIYNSTQSKLVAMWDHGSGLSVAVGANYNVVINASGLFTAVRSP